MSKVGIMNKQEYKKLCEVMANLNVALCALTDEQNQGFTNPLKSAKDGTMRAYLLLDRMLIKYSNYDNQ
jgi:hypothetical protein